MSASGRIAKKVETKRRWEEALVEHKDCIVYFRHVFVWKRPIDFGVFVALFTISLWFLFTTETTTITIVGTTIMAWAVASFLATTSNLKIPWANFLPPPEQNDNSVDYYGEMIGLFVSLKYAAADIIDHVHRIRTSNPSSFLIQSLVAGGLMAFFGGYFSGFVVFILSLYGILLLPGIVANKIPQKVIAITEPYVRVYVDKAKILIHAAVAQIQQYLQKKGNKPAPTSPASPRGKVNAPSSPRGENSNGPVAVSETQPTSPIVSEEPVDIQQ